jgi:hypothetical protein
LNTIILSKRSISSVALRVFWAQPYEFIAFSNYFYEFN